MIKKIICEKQPFIAKDGKERVDYRFFLVLENGNKIRISAYYSNFSDESKNYSTFRDLMLLSEVVELPLKDTRKK